MEQFFHLKEHGTTVRREIFAGLTTFLAMSYILAVNPSILGNVMNASGVFVATAVASAAATFIMGVWANYPIALSAGMGLNAYFAFTVCLGELQGDPNAFKVGLTAVFVEGIVFIILSLFHFREKIINAIPANLKFGISAGIGLFIAFIGLSSAGITVADPSTLVALGSFGSAPMVLALLGFLLILLLVQHKIPGAVLIGILATWIMGMIAQAIGWYTGPSVFPDFSAGLQLGGIKETAFQLDFGWAATHIAEFVAITFSFLFVDLFDTVGTVVGVADKADLLDENGELPRVGRVFLADAFGTTLGACLGTSTVTSYVESSTGVAAGGRTGLASVTTAVLFLASLVLSPFFLAIPSFATTPALMYVGLLMVASAQKIKFHGEIADVAGAYMALIIMPMTYSIANGIMLGVITWVLLKTLTGKARDIHPVMWVVFALFAVRIVSLVLG